MSKPKIAVFDFACCEGCQLQCYNLEEEIIDLLSVVEPVEWREAMSDKSDEFDIAIIEGSITRPEDEERLREIRAKAKVLIAIGACATIGGVNSLKNNFPLDDVKKCVYGDDAGKPHLDTARTKAVGDVVDVDYRVEGCPMTKGEFTYIVRCLLMGKEPVIPDYPVCVECKANGTICRYEYDEICLGVVTRAGCGAPCPAGGMACFGCRGYAPNPNVDAAREVMDKYGKTLADLQEQLLLFNTDQEPTHVDG